MTTALELIRRWIVALRSGNYKQGTVDLRQENFTGGNCYCGIGVFLDVVDPNGWTKSDIYEGVYTFRGDSEKYMAFPNWKHWDDSSPEKEVIQLPKMHNVWRMNDRGASFEELAMYIEENILPEFSK